VQALAVLIFLIFQKGFFRTFAAAIPKKQFPLLKSREYQIIMLSASVAALCRSVIHDTAALFRQAAAI